MGGFGFEMEGYYYCDADYGHVDAEAEVGEECLRGVSWGHGSRDKGEGLRQAKEGRMRRWGRRGRGGILRSFAQWSRASLSVLAKRRGPKNGGTQNICEAS